MNVWNIHRYIISGTKLQQKKQGNILLKENKTNYRYSSIVLQSKQQEHKMLRQNER